MMQNQDDSANSIDSSSSNLTVKVEKVDTPKKYDIKDDVEDPKPRIVLTFRSEKSGAKNSNMKIITPEEKQEEVSPRRSSRTRSVKQEIYEESELLSKRDKSQSSHPVSENDETSDSSHTTKRSSRGRSKEGTDALSVAVARKEKSYNEAVPTPPQRLSRRIKPTAKILANEELRIGLESQNNARLGIQLDKADEGVSTRRSGQAKVAEVASERRSTKRKAQEVKAPEEAPKGDNSVMKLKHLCELGLKAISKSADEDSSDDNENSEVNVGGEEGEDEEIDDDTEIINKLLEADEEWGGESSDDEYLLSEENSQSDRPRRSRRLCSSYGANDSDQSSLATVEEKPKTRPRRSSRRNMTRVCYEYASVESAERDDDNESVEREYVPKRKKTRSSLEANDLKGEIEDEENWEFTPKRKKNRTFEADDKSENEDENSNPAVAEEGSEAACPTDTSAVVATCFCEEPSNVYASPSELTEPVFCQAIEMIDGIRVGCSHPARREDKKGDEEGEDGEGVGALLRAGPRAPFFLACKLHAAQLAKHMCCPTCGLFCTQGIFYQCSKEHLFHMECGILSTDAKLKPGCPHCGVTAYRWQPANRDCAKVQLVMHCSNERIYLPDQRVQRTQAYLTFSTSDKPVDTGPVIPAELLPSLPIDLKKMYEDSTNDDQTTAKVNSIEPLYEAIVNGETVEQLIPKIVRGSQLDGVVEAGEAGGGSCVHAAAARGRLGALYLLQFAGAALDALDAAGRTPLMRAILALLEKEIEAEVEAEGKAKDLEDDADVDIATVVNASTEEKVEKEDEMELEHPTEGLEGSVKEETEDVKEEIEEADDVKGVETKKATDENVDIKEENSKDKSEIKKQEDEEVKIKKESVEEKETEDDKEKAGEDKTREEDLMKVIRYLVAAGCDLNLPGPEGMTALHMAAQYGGQEVCEILLNGGADVDARDQGGWTPLVRACEHSRTEVVRVLLRHGAEAGTVDREGNGAVHWCALAGAAPALRLLLAAAPHVAHATNAHADTPLHIAAREGHYSCVVILLARGARTDVKNSADHLPVDGSFGQCQAAITLNMQMALAVKKNVGQYRLLSSDISRGREPYPVECVNEVDDEPLPQFTYVSKNVITEPINIDYSLQSLQGCNCTDGSCELNECSCGELSVRRWYRGGRLPPNFPYHDPPMLFECNQTCACDLKRCSNHVVSRLEARGSIGARVTVFRTGARGWGLRAAQDIARGAPVALYCGELLPHSVADARDHDHYMFSLDIKPDLLEQCSDKTTLCVDAARHGGCARFVNHSCAPNLAPVRVFTAARDLRLPAVALFARAHIRRGDELTFDYGDKFWAVKSKWMSCECKSPDCRYAAKPTYRV